MSQRRALGLAILALGILLAGSVVTATAATAQPSSDEIGSAVVPQPDGLPSVFVGGNESTGNWWYGGGEWLLYPFPVSSVSSPAVVLQLDGSPSVFFQGAGGSLWNYWYVSGTWYSRQIASGGVESAPAAILQPDGAPSVFVVGPNRSLLNYWYIPSQGGWGAGTVAPADSAFSAPAAVVNPSSDAPEVFVEGPNHSLVYYFYCAIGCGVSPRGSWSGEAVAAGAGSYNLAFSAPAVVGQPDGDVSVFVVGPDNSLGNYWGGPYETQCEATANWFVSCWSSGTVAGDGLAHSAPALTLQPDGVPSAFTLGPNGSLLNFWYISSQRTWGSATVESPTMGVSQVVGVLGQTDGTPEVFFDAGGILWTSSYSQGTWGNAPVYVLAV